MHIFITIAFIFLGLVILSLIYSFIDEVFAKDGGVYEGVVIERDYTPESNHTGVGPALGGSGGMAVTISHEDEKWVLICKLNDKVKPIETSKENWVKYDSGDKVKVAYSLGRFSGDVYLGDLV